MNSLRRIKQLVAAVVAVGIILPAVSMSVRAYDYVTYEESSDAQEISEPTPTSEDDPLRSLYDIDAIYADIINALNEGKTSVRLLKHAIKVEDVYWLVTTFLSENPEYSFLSHHPSFSYHSDLITSITLTHIYNEEELAELDAVYRDVSSLIDENMSDFDKALFVHDYISRRVRYAYDEYYNDTLYEIRYVYNAHGCLVKQYCVCAGYASAYCYIMNRLGVPCKYVHCDPMNHAWNVIKIDGQWYQVDMTWDDGIPNGCVGHGYFLKSDDCFINNLGHHDWVNTENCTSTRFDDAWFNNIKSQIGIYNGSYYYVERVGNEYNLIKRTGEDTEILKTIEMYQRFTEDGQYFYLQEIYLSMYQNNVYYTNGKDIICYNVDNGEEEVLYTIEDGLIYDLCVLESGYARFRTEKIEENNYTEIKLFDGHKTPEPVDSPIGECGIDGDNLMYEVVEEEDGLTLYITGEGDMADYLNVFNRPWDSYAEDITRIVIEDGVTGIGVNAFNGFESLTEIAIPDSVTSILNKAFANTGLTTVTVPDSVENVGTYVFLNCDNLTSASIECKYALTCIFEDCDNLVTIYISCITDLEDDFEFDYPLPKTITVETRHNFDGQPYSQDENDMHYVVCTNCDEETKHEACEGGIATCSTLAKCDVCENTYGDYDTDHHDDIVADKRVEATETETGLTEGTHCGACGVVIVPQEVIPMITPEPTEEPTPTPTEEPTEEPTPTPTEEPTEAPTPTPTPAPSVKEGVEGFCERLYTCALKRNSDPAGIATWMDELNSGRKNGAEVAVGFFFSDEFKNSNISDEEYINRLYATFMNREPDEAGFNTWKKVMNDGWTREQVFMGFIDSKEWANVCYEYGIASGGSAKPDIKEKPSDEVIAFATRLYTTCLGRDGDKEGIKNWSEYLAEHKCTGTEAAHGFFFSKEFIEAEYSDEEFINRLYRTFMDREADEVGYTTWRNALEGGWSREDVFYGFANSNEFNDICVRYGIDR